MMNTQRYFWNLVDSGEITVINKQACIDALRDTPLIEYSDFMHEALEYNWIDDQLLSREQKATLLLAWRDPGTYADDFADASDEIINEHWNNYLELFDE